MNPCSVDISDILEAESSLGLILGENLFIGKEPDSPNNCVTIFDTPGFPPQLTYIQGENYFYPSIQIRVRNIDYLDGWEMVNDIKNLLHGRGQETWNGTLYSVIVCVAEPSLLDWDKNGRAHFVITFNIQRR